MAGLIRVGRLIEVWDTFSGLSSAGTASQWLKDRRGIATMAPHRGILRHVATDESSIEQADPPGKDDRRKVRHTSCLSSNALFLQTRAGIRSANNQKCVILRLQKTVMLVEGRCSRSSGFSNYIDYNLRR
jgi:hypothetical protein